MIYLSTVTVFKKTSFLEILETKPEKSYLKYLLILQRAIKFYNKYLAIAPDHMQTHFNLAYALMMEGRYRKAIKYFERALILNPNYREVHLHLANCNGKIGNKAGQAEHLALYNKVN